MDILLNRVTQHALNYAIRSGISITAGYVVKQTGRLLKNVEAPQDRYDLETLQQKLQSKIRIISPAIDMIELISARGNTTLESALELTSKLRQDIQALAQRLEAAAAEKSLAREGSSKRSNMDLKAEIVEVILDLERLIKQIEDAVPFLNLALTASGAKISTSMPPTVSPSRLLQASTFVTEGDSRYALHPSGTQVGPTFTLSLYMLFAGHVRPQTEEEVRSSTWKEVLHKARLKLMRIPTDDLRWLRGRKDPDRATNLSHTSSAPDEYAYQLLLIEDLDDDRVHTFEDDEPLPSSFEDVAQAGIREILPVHEISKIFYADTGKILNIGDDDVHRPVLLLKRDMNTSPPHHRSDLAASTQEDSPSLRTTERVEAFSNSIQSALDAQLQPRTPVTQEAEDEKKTDSAWCIAPGLDPEWLAFEVYTEQPDTEEELNDDTAETGRDSPRILGRSPTSHLAQEMDAIQFKVSKSPKQSSPKADGSGGSPFPQIKTSLSLLEAMLRIVSLQQFKQMSHLSIEDEFLTYFLTESSTIGAADGDEHERRKIREDARRRVGFDPYNESPIKRHGESYQYRGGTSQAGWDDELPGFYSPRSSFGDTSIVRSIEESAPSPQITRTGVITPRGSPFSASDLPPLTNRRVSERMYPARSSLSPSLPRYFSLKSTPETPGASPLGCSVLARDVTNLQNGENGSQTDSGKEAVRVKIASIEVDLHGEEGKKT